jgi:GntP family permease
MSDVAVIVNTAVAIAAVVVMIVRFKFNAVVSLVVGSAYLGLATGLGTYSDIDHEAVAGPRRPSEHGPRSGIASAWRLR